jgi:hypothetical protein
MRDIEQDRMSAHGHGRYHGPAVRRDLGICEYRQRRSVLIDCYRSTQVYLHHRLT